MTSDDFPQVPWVPTPSPTLAPDQVLPVVYAELRRIASGCLAGEQTVQTLQATALVHEAWLKVGNHHQVESRTHFVRLAATAMRQILVDNARARSRLKRGGGQPNLELEESGVPCAEPEDRILVLNEALETFSKEHPEAARIVEMRYFLGLTLQQISDQLGSSPRTIDRQWAFARAWLKRELRQLTPKSGILRSPDEG